MYDYFVAPLRCPVCGRISPADSSTNMQTHLSDDASGRELTVGFEFDPMEVRPQDIVDSDYLPVSPPPADGTATLLETWQCPHCGAADLWAAVALLGGRIESIEAVALDRETLARAHFIDEGCSMLAARLSGIAWADFAPGQVDAVAVLREYLPVGGKQRDEGERG